MHNPKRRTLIPILYRLSQYELADVDNLVVWFKSSAEAERKRVDGLPTDNGPDDQYSDAYGEIESVSHLNSELAVIALWRCVELSRRRVIGNTLGTEAAKDSAYNSKIASALRRIDIRETTIQRAEDVDELRCLNNAIKHDGYVSSQLAKFPHWKNEKGEELSNLDSVIPRLREAADAYIEDLMHKADEWLNKVGTNPGDA